MDCCRAELTGRQRQRLRRASTETLLLLFRLQAGNPTVPPPCPMSRNCPLLSVETRGKVGDKMEGHTSSAACKFQR